MFVYIKLVNIFIFNTVMLVKYLKNYIIALIFFKYFKFVLLTIFINVKFVDQNFFKPFNLLNIFKCSLCYILHTVLLNTFLLKLS